MNANGHQLSPRSGKGVEGKMLMTILIGSLTLLINMMIQVYAVVAILRYIMRRLNSETSEPTIGKDMRMMGMALMGLFLGHLLQFATWAMLFVYLGEFNDFQTAFYHSVVNFTSLGYGDIVMSERWRLLGGLEAANGILMFGLTTSTFVAVMSRLFSRHKAYADAGKTSPPPG